MPKKKELSLTAVKPHSVKKQPTHEQIALRAYEIYLERNGAPGNPLEDWTHAERELREKASKSSRKAGPKLVAA